MKMLVDIEAGGFGPGEMMVIMAGRRTGKSTLYGFNTEMDQFTKALNNAWAQWPEIKHTVTDFGFKDWCKREHGFEYHRYFGGQQASVTKIHDEQKYAWFLLKWA
jgi:hypothetical protein